MARHKLKITGHEDTPVRKGTNTESQMVSMLSGRCSLMFDFQKPFRLHIADLRSIGGSKTRDSSGAGIYSIWECESINSGAALAHFAPSRQVRIRNSGLGGPKHIRILVYLDKLNLIL